MATAAGLTILITADAGAAVAGLNQAQQSLQAIQRAAGQTASATASVTVVLNQVGQAARGAGGAADEAGGHFSRLGQIVNHALGDLAAQAISKVTGAITDAISSIGSFANEMEQASVSFGVLTGSAQQAEETLNELKNFAKTTPFNFTQVEEESKKLLAYGENVKNLIPDMTMLGNIAAGVGTQKLPLLTLAFGQVMTAGHLMGGELRQFTENGVNLLDALSKSLGKPIPVIQQMVHEGQIGFSQVRAALAGLASDGGIFADMMAKQSRTFQGAMSNIQDAVQQVGAAAFAPLFSVLRDAALLLGDFLNSDAASSWASGMASAMQSVADGIRLVGTVIGNAIRLISSSGPAMEVVKAALLGIAGAIATAVIPALYGMAAGWVAAAAPAIALAIVIGTVVLAVKVVIDHFSLFQQAADIVGTALARLANFIAERVGPAFEGLGRLVGSVASFILDRLGGIVSAAGPLLDKIGIDVGGVQATLAGFASGAQGMFDGFKIAAAGAYDAVGNGFKTLGTVAGQGADLLKQALSELTTEFKVNTDTAKQAPLVFTAVADSLGKDKGVGKKAKEAKDALQQLGIEADAVRKAMELLGYSIDKQQAIIKALGGHIQDVGEKIRDVGLTGEQLFAAFRMAGMGAAEAASEVQRLFDIVAQKHALEDAKVTVDNLRKAMDMLGITAAEQTQYLIHAGVAAADAAPEIEGVGVSAERLERGFRLMGFSAEQAADAVAKVIEQARKTHALDASGVSVSTLREAMGMLKMSADEIRTALEAVGVSAMMAGPLLEGLGVTAEQLAAAFNAAGLNGEEMVKRVQAAIAAKKAEAELKQATQDAQQAQQEAARAAEEYRKKLEELAKTAQDQVVPAFQALAQTIAGGFSVGQITAFAAQLNSVLDAMIARRQQAAGVIVPGVTADPKSIGKEPPAAGAAAAVQAVTAATFGATQAVQDQTKALEVNAFGWERVVEVLKGAGQRLVDIALKNAGLGASASAASKAIAESAQMAVALEKAHGDLAGAIGVATNNLDALQEKLKNLAGPDAEAAQVLMNAVRQLIADFRDGKISAEAFALGIQAAAGYLDALATKSDTARAALEKLREEQAKAQSAAWDDLNKQVKDQAQKAADEAEKRVQESADRMATALRNGLSKGTPIAGALQDFAKAEWIADLEAQVKKAAYNISVLIKNGLDPTAYLEAYKKLFEEYARATTKTLEELNREAQQRILEEQKQNYQEMAKAYGDALKQNSEAERIAYDESRKRLNDYASQYAQVFASLTPAGQGAFNGAVKYVPGPNGVLVPVAASINGGQLPASATPQYPFPGLAGAPGSAAAGVGSAAPPPNPAELQMVATLSEIRNGIYLLVSKDSTIVVNTNGSVRDGNSAARAGGG
jgi:tape measure domain-containing protein